MSSFDIRDLLVGKKRVEPRLEYKNALLRGYMSLLCIAVGLLYIVMDGMNGLFANYPFYFATITLGLAVIWLNHGHRYHFANITFLVTVNLIIFLFAASDQYRTGVYLFFICSSLSAFALFGYRQIRWAVFFSMISLLLFLFSYWGGFRVLPVTPYSEKYITVSFISNFVISLTSSMVILYFLININYRSEAALTKTTEELQRSRERNQMVLDAVDAGTYEWNNSTQAVFVSDNWKKLLGYEPHELADFNFQFFFEILHPEDQAVTQKNIAQHFQDKKPYVTELRLRNKAGVYKWFLDSGGTRFGEKGEPLITAGCIIDINERKVAQEKILKQNELLEKTNGELDRFVYSVSHDLRAPLSSILGLTNLYRLSADARERESVVLLIKERALTLDSFISEILDYSRNARTELKKQSVGVYPLVLDLLKGLTYIPGFERIRITVEVPPELDVITDRERLKMVLNNLISNAIKYSDQHRESFIRIAAETKGENFLLSVEDNGIGIKAEHHNRIFDMFYQAHDHGHGSGLGLYIVKETLQRLQGHITFQSEYGKGSTFTLEMPAKI